MPELPEVETIKRELKSKILNQKILGCQILRNTIIGYPDATRFCSRIMNERILNVNRQAKYLILELTNNKRLIFHLRLSGKLFTMENLNEKPEKIKYPRLLLRLKDKWLIFSEPRALGRVYLLEENDRPAVLKGFFNLSCEPLNSKYDLAYFREKIKGRKAMIKALLLDQSICAGVGNIYSDEALFHAGIRPTRRADTLTRAECARLLKELKKVLRKAIAQRGTTVSDYRRTDGKKGNFQKFLYVYDRENQPCKKCGAKILLMKVGSRSTRYCPRCQK